MSYQEFEKIFTEKFGVGKPFKDVIESALQNNDYVDIKKVSDETKTLLFGSSVENAFLFPSGNEMEILEETHFSDTLSVYLVRGMKIFPTASYSRSRWWICVYVGEWENASGDVNRILNEEGSLNWRKKEVPWIVRNGKVMKLASGSQTKIACARKRETT